MERKILQLLKRTKKVKLLFLSLLFTVMALQINAQDNIVYEFNDGDPMNSDWAQSGSTISFSGGKMTVTFGGGNYSGIKLLGLSLENAVFTQMEVVFANNCNVQKIQLGNLDNNSSNFGAGTNETFTDVLNDNVERTRTWNIVPNPDNAGLIHGLFLRAGAAGITGTWVIERITLISLNDGGVSYDLTTSVVGNGRVDPAAGSYAENSEQTITAIPFFGNTFTGWSGDLTGTTNPETLTMDAAKSVTATFEAIPDFDFIWNFNTDADAEGWINAQSTGSVASGVNTMQITGTTPKMTVADLAIPTDDYAVVEIRMKNNTAVDGASGADVMKINATTAAGNNYRNLDDSYLGEGIVTGNDTEFKTYQIPISGGNYTGNLDGLEFLGPKNLSNLDGSETVEVDYIKMVKKVNQTITFDAITDAELGDTILLNKLTDADANLTIKYESSDSTIIDVSNDTLFMLALGAATITASQAGDPWYYAASNVAHIISVNKASQTITFDALAAKTFGDANFDLTATASSGLAVAYESSNESVATISGNTVTIVGVGTTTITASQAGDDSYSAATPVEQALVVSKADQTITFDALAAKIVGDAAFDLTATASSGLAITYSSSDENVAQISGATVTIVGAGSTIITASQEGDASYNAAADVPQQLLVTDPALLDQTITFPALPAKVVGDADFDLTATASSGLAVTYVSSDLNVATITGSTVTIIGVGTTNITASQAGNDSYNPALDVLQDLVVNKLDQTITFAVLANKTYGDVDFDLTATASSGLTVSYSSSDETVAQISGTTVTIVGAGTVTITASQVGNDTVSAATAVTQDLVINKADQTITFDALAEKNESDPDFDLTATASSGLTVSYSSSDETVAQISGTTVTIIGVGTATITASQAGNDNYNAATSVEQQLVIEDVNAINDNFAEFNMYPNPAKSYVLISNTSIGDHLLLVNTTGKVLLNQVIKNSEQTIDVSTFEQGLYIVRIVNKDKQISKKLIISK